MPPITLEQYTEAFNNTPKNLKDVLFADFTSVAIKNATQRHNVQDNAMDVSAIIGYTLVGLIPVKKFIDVLKEETGLDEKTAKNIAYEIREQVFAPVAQTLAEMQEKAQENWEHAKKALQNIETELAEQKEAPKKDGEELESSPSQVFSENLGGQEKESAQKDLEKQLKSDDTLR